MACPGFDLLIKSVNAVMISMEARMVTIASPLMEIRPSASFRAGIETTDLNDFGFEVKISKARFYRK